MFPLPRSDDLFTQICSDLHHRQISQLSKYQSQASSSSSLLPSDHINMIKTETFKRKANKFLTGDLSLGDKSLKMKLHRDNERQRRQEMASLFASLRSLLPLEFIKGKRSMSDHLHECVNYIKHLQKQVKRLEVKRNEVKKMSDSSTASYADSCFMVRPCLVGIEVMYCCGLGEQCCNLPLSKVLELLLEQGLAVVNCVSTKADNSNFLHYIQIEVEDVTAFDVSQLQQKLVQLAKQ